MRKYRGYMTLEASLIVPMVICIFVVLIYFTYYLYGRCVLSQDSYILAFRASVNMSSEYKDNPVGYVEEAVSRVTGKKYFGSTKPYVKAEKSKNEVIVRGYANVRSRAMGRYFLKPQSGWDYMAAARAKKLDAAKHMRKIKRIRDIGNRTIK